MLTGDLAKVLSVFRGVDALQTDLMLDVLCVEDRDRVPVGDFDNFARDGLRRFARAAAEDAQRYNENEERAYSEGGRHNASGFRSQSTSIDGNAEETHEAGYPGVCGRPAANYSLSRIRYTREPTLTMGAGGTVRA